MSGSLTATTDHPDDDAETTPHAVLESAPPLADVAASPQVITEQEVVFSTAAAIPAQPIRWWTRASRTLAAAIAGISATSAADPKPKRRHYPPRADYLEYSRMRREMDRL